MEDLVEPTLLQIKEEEEEMLQIKEEEESWEEEEAREIKEEEEELCIKQEGSDDEGSGSSRDLIRNESAEAAGDPAALPANQASAGPAPARQNRPAAAGGLTRTRAPLWNTSQASRSVRKRKRARKLHRRLLLVNGLISESLLLLGETPGRRSARRRNAVLHLDSFDKTKAALLLHATQTVLHSISCDLNVISRGSCDSTC